VVWSVKNRRAPITKDRGPRFVWSKEHNMHITTDAPTPKTGAPKSYDPEELIGLLPAAGLKAGAWQKKAGVELGLKEATFHRARRELAQAKRVLRSSTSGRWQPISPKNH